MSNHTNGDTNGALLAGERDIQQRLAAFRESDQRRDELLTSIAQAYQVQEARLQELQSDLANEQKSRREWQRQAQYFQDECSRTQNTQSANPFMVALIDGDGAPFLDSLIGRGTDGGKEAAHKLDVELRKSVADLHPTESTAHWDLLVFVFVNLDGMQSKLRACGMLKPGQDLSSFAQAFGFKLFQFVDVGFGKERADYKMREFFRLYVNNIQCKHLVLGGVCHDNGYLPMLDPYVHDSEQHKRISFLVTLPAEPAYKSMSFQRFSITSVFRSEHLPSRPVRNTSNGPFMTGSDSIVTNGMGLMQLSPISSHDRSDSGLPERAEHQHQQLLQHKTASLTSPSPAPSSEAGSWATVSKAADDTKEFQIATRKPQVNKHILYNRDAQRIDAPIPIPTKADNEKLYSRINSTGKVCNAFYLLGKCLGKCGFNHGDKMLPGELIALRFRARTRPCPWKGQCEDVNCTMGHVCPYGNVCYGDTCAFKDSHGVDLTPSFRLYEDDRVELIH